MTGAVAVPDLAIAKVRRFCEARIPPKLQDEIRIEVAEHARTVKVGDGSSEGTEIGPISNRPQYDRVTELVDDALQGGARAAAGGRPMDSEGYFFEPTILDNVTDGVRIVDEEQFGPALPVIAYRDLDDAVERANATHFGLGGSVDGGEAVAPSRTAMSREWSPRNGAPRHERGSRSCIRSRNGDAGCRPGLRENADHRDRCSRASCRRTVVVIPVQALAKKASGSSVTT